MDIETQISLHGPVPYHEAVGRGHRLLAAPVVDAPSIGLCGPATALRHRAGAGSGVGEPQILVSFAAGAGADIHSAGSRSLALAVVVCTIDSRPWPERSQAASVQHGESVGCQSLAVHGVSAGKAQGLLRERLWACIQLSS